MDSRRRKRDEGTPKYKFTEASNIGSDIEEHNVDSNTDGSDDEDYENEVLEEFYDSDYDLVEGKKDDREFDKYVDVTVEYRGVQKSPVADHGVEGAEVDNDKVEGGTVAADGLDFSDENEVSDGDNDEHRTKRTPQPINEPVNEPVNEAVRVEVNEPVSEPVNEAVREKVNEPVNEPVADVIAVNTQPEMDFDEADLYVQLPILEPVKEPVRPTRPNIPFIRKKTAAVKAPGLKKPIAAVLRKKPFTRSSAQVVPQISRTLILIVCSSVQSINKGIHRWKTSQMET
nr:winged helix-turn-helix transcriptional regulator [Ipomoea batatas]